MNNKDKAKLIKQGKLVDQWGRKIKTEKKLYNDYEVAKIVIVVMFAEYLLLSNIDKIKFLIDYIITSVK